SGNLFFQLPDTVAQRFAITPRLFLTLLQITGGGPRDARNQQQCQDEERGGPHGLRPAWPCPVRPRPPLPLQSRRDPRGSSDGWGAADRPARRPAADL